MKMILFPRRILLPSMWKPRSSCNTQDLWRELPWAVLPSGQFLVRTLTFHQPLPMWHLVKASMLNSIQITLHEPLLHINTCACVISCFSCLTLCHPMDCSPPGSSVHGILQARILEWVLISYSRGSSQPRDQTPVPCNSCFGRWILYYCT